MEKNTRTEFVRTIGSTRLIVDGRTQIDFTETEFKALMLGVLNDIWNLKGQTTDAEKLSWLAEVQQHLAPAQEQN